MFKIIIQNIARNSSLIKHTELNIYQNTIKKSRLFHNTVQLLCKDTDNSDQYTLDHSKYKDWQVDQVKDIIQDVKKRNYAFDDGDMEFSTDIIFDTNDEQLLQEEGILIKSSIGKPTPKKFDRGVTGVFDIEQIVEILKAEKAIDIAVLKVPKEIRYCDYLIILCPRSAKHAISMAENINKIYKATKYKKDPFLAILKEDSDWIAVDMGNIVIHIMANRLRMDFDIEALWTLGVDYDPLVKLASQEEDLYLVKDEDLNNFPNFV